ncbi:MAG: GcrA family cell cycle regulator [Pseudomonadota bacterium]
MTWTDERVDLLKKYWTEGLSASQIAGKLGGVTRNAVIGKVHRLGLSGRATPARPERGRASPARAKPAVTPGVQRDAAISEPKPVYPEPEWSPPIVLQSGEKATVTTLKSQMCKWPVGDPTHEDFHFCGQPALAGKPYCAYHARLAYQPSQAKRDRRPERERVATLPPQRRAANQ